MKLRLPSLHLSLASLRHSHATPRDHSGRGSGLGVAGPLPGRTVRPVVIPEFKQWMVLPFLNEPLPAKRTQSQTKPVHQNP